MFFRRIIIPTLILSSFLIQSCDEEPTFWLYDTIYSNSFETESDMEGWSDTFSLSTDVPAEGGFQSLIVPGSCVLPCIEYKLDAQPEDCYLKFRAWGKMLTGNGNVHLAHRNDRSNSVGFAIRDTVWTMYESADNLFCPAGEPLVIYINCGGFGGGAMLVDLLDVLRGKR